MSVHTKFVPIDYSTWTDKQKISALQRDWRIFRMFDDPSPEVRKAAIYESTMNILFIDNPTIEEGRYCLTHDHDSFTFMPDELKEQLRIEILAEAGWYINHIDNPTEIEQLLAVTTYGHAIKHLKNPSESVKMKAMMNHGPAIRFLENPSRLLRASAIFSGGEAIQYIDNPSIDEIMLAVNEDIYAINLVDLIITKDDIAMMNAFSDMPVLKGKTEEELIEIVDKYPYAGVYIKNPSPQIRKIMLRDSGVYISGFDDVTEEEKLIAASQNGDALKYIDNPSEAVQIAAVTEDGRALRYIKNPSEAVQLAAVANNGYYISRIRNPSEAVQLAAVENNKYNGIDYIRNPTDFVIETAMSVSDRVIMIVKNPSQTLIDVHNVIHVF